jgi:hypothetical protein
MSFSDSFRIIAKYDCSGIKAGKRLGFHSAWGDLDETLTGYGRCSNPLFATIDGEESPPRVLLFNPKHQRFPTDLEAPRFTKNDQWRPISINDEDDAVYPQVDVNSSPLPSPRPLEPKPDTSVEMDGVPEGTDAIPKITYTPAPSDDHVPRMVPFGIRTKGLDKISAETAKMLRKDIDPAEIELYSTAISPRGADWIVAVGSAGLICVFEMRAEAGGQPADETESTGSIESLYSSSLDGNSDDGVMIDMSNVEESNGDVDMQPL